MIYLGKLLKEDDLHIFFYANSTVLSGDQDILNTVTDDLNSTNFTLNSYQSTTEAVSIPFDPYYVSYTIIDNTRCKNEIIRQTINSKPMKFDKGFYYAPIKISPRIFRIGRHYIVWSFRRFCDSALFTKKDSFDVIRPANYSGEFCRSTYAPDYACKCSSENQQKSKTCKCSK
jgi:hypothetical protein